MLLLLQDNFTNYGNISADTLTLSVAGDFDYTNEFLGNGNIDATTLNLQVGGDFSYDDASNDFVWNAQNSLVVFGSAFITADDFSNYGAINVVNDFNVTAADYFSNQDNTQQSMRIASMLQQEAALSIITQLLVRITSMLTLSARVTKTFTIQIVQRLMQITSMLQQEETFTISITQQSIRITSMLHRTMTFSIETQQSMRITSMLQQDTTFTILS